MQLLPHTALRDAASGALLLVLPAENHVRLTVDAPLKLNHLLLLLLLVA